MGEETETQPVNYIELTLKQAKAVEETADRHKESPTKDSALQLEIELEKLCFYQTSAKGKPKIRALQAAERAKAIVLARAITKPTTDTK